VLLLLHTLGGYLLLVALMSHSEGPWDHTVTGMVRSFAIFSAGAELMATAVTFGCVRAGVLRTWWYAVPTLMLVTAVFRTVFAPVP